MIARSTLQVFIEPDGTLKFHNTAQELLRQKLPPQRRGDRWLPEALLQTTESIYGLGERAAPLNLRSEPNTTYRMWNDDAGGRYGPGTDPLYLCIPVYIGLHPFGSYLVFYENSYESHFSFSDRATANF